MLEGAKESIMLKWGGDFEEDFTYKYSIKSSKKSYNLSVVYLLVSKRF